MIEGSSMAPPPRWIRSRHSLLIDLQVVPHMRSSWGSVQAAVSDCACRRRAHKDAGKDDLVAEVGEAKGVPRTNRTRPAARATSMMPGEACDDGNQTKPR